MSKLARDGLRLRDLLRFEPLALEHVQKVGIAAEVELVSAVESHPALPEKVGQNAVHDGGSDLGFDVIANDR